MVLCEKNRIMSGFVFSERIVFSSHVNEQGNYQFWKKVLSGKKRTLGKRKENTPPMNTSEWNSELMHASSTSSLGSRNPRPLPQFRSPPPYSNYWNRRSIRFWPIASPAGEKAWLAWVDFSAPIRSGERRWTARPVSWRSWSDTDPMPCLGFTTVLCLLSRRLFWRIRFLFFSGCLGRRSWNRRRSGMCCDVSAQILVFRIPRHLSIFVKRGLLLPQQIALYLHDTETLMYCIHSHASLLLWFQYFGIE